MKSGGMNGGGASWGQSSLAGNSKTAIICNVSLASANLTQTISTLQFASRSGWRARTSGACGPSSWIPLSVGKVHEEERVYPPLLLFHFRHPFWVIILLPQIYGGPIPPPRGGGGLNESWDLRRDRFRKTVIWTPPSFFYSGHLK